MKILLRVGHALVLFGAAMGVYLCWYMYTMFQAWIEETGRGGSVSRTTVTVLIAFLAFLFVVVGLKVAHVLAVRLASFDGDREERERVEFRDQAISSIRTNGSPRAEGGGEH